jgi:CRISPR-associated protein Cas2
METNLHEQSQPQDKVAVEEYSCYKMGWILVMFDLPVVDDKDRAKASKFRRDLLKTGFSMVQESIYARPCMTASRVQTACRDLNNILPGTGLVMVLFVTDHQWFNATVIASKGLTAEDRALPEQAEIWDESAEESE